MQREVEREKEREDVLPSREKMPFIIKQELFGKW